MYVIAMYVKEGVKMVKRYDCDWEYGMSISGDGDWVSHDDYAALQAECERLRGVSVVDGWIEGDPLDRPAMNCDIKWSNGKTVMGYVFSEQEWQCYCQSAGTHITHWRPSKVEE